MPTSQDNEIGTDRRGTRNPAKEYSRGEGPCEMGVISVLSDKIRHTTALQNQLLY